jgi:hypothetical protein
MGIERFDVMRAGDLQFSGLPLFRIPVGAALSI